MKAAKSIGRIVTAGSILLATSGCIIPPIYRFESGFIPSPSGQSALSHTESCGLLWLGGEPIELSRKEGLRVRRLRDGSLRMEIPRSERWRQVYPSRWSPNEQRVAFRAEDRLWVASADRGEAQLIADEVSSSFAWVDPSNLVYVVPPCSVYRFSCPDGGRALLFTGRHGESSRWAFHYSNQVSEEGRFFAYSSRDEACFVDLTQGEVLHSFPIPEKFADVCWSPEGDFCLARTFLTGLYPEDKLYVYDREKGTLTDLTSAIPTGKEGRRERVFHLSGWGASAGGKWFLVGVSSLDVGSMRDYVCGLDSGSVTCLQEAVGAEFRDPRVANRGDGIALIKKGKDAGVYVTRVQLCADGRALLSRPRKLFRETSFASWFWSADGRRLLVFKGGRFLEYDVGGVAH